MLYDRKCNDCAEIFEVNCKMADKGNVFFCPACDSVNGEWIPVTPNFTMRGDRLMTQKKDGGFKEVLQKIQERNKRTSVSEQ